MWPLSKIHQVGELIAAVAVVISLIFVGYEVHQNNQRQIQATTQTMVSDYASGLLAVANDAELACIYVRGTVDYLSLTGAEQLRLSIWLVAMMRFTEDMYFQMQAGSIDPMIWAGIETTTSQTIRTPGFQQWFAHRGTWFSEPFRDYVEGMNKDPTAVPAATRDDPQCHERDITG